MARNKSGIIVNPWLSARPDNREARYIQPGNSLLLSDEFKGVSPGARLMYLCMAMEAAGKRNFTFSKATGIKYGFPYSTHTRHIKELIEKRFIQLDSSGWNTREKNRYSFSTTLWKPIEE